MTNSNVCSLGPELFPRDLTIMAGARPGVKTLKGLMIFTNASVKREWERATFQLPPSSVSGERGVETK